MTDECIEWIDGLKSIWNRLYYQYKDDLCYTFLEQFWENYNAVNNDPNHGFKWHNIEMCYHKVKSKYTTTIQFRCRACEMATQVYTFAENAQRAKAFLANFEEIVAPMLTTEDPVDITQYTPPEDPPMPQEYRCHFEDNRHQNDVMKEWAAKTRSEDVAAVIPTEEEKSAFVDQLWEAIRSKRTVEEAKTEIRKILWHEENSGQASSSSTEERNKEHV